MKILVLYFLAGAMVAVWTAINQNSFESSDRSPRTEITGVSYLPAYIFIGLAWPVSLFVSIYSVVQGFRAGEQ